MAQRGGRCARVRDARPSRGTVSPATIQPTGRGVSATFQYHVHNTRTPRPRGSHGAPRIYGVAIDVSTTFLHIYTNSISFAFIYTHTPYIQYPCVRMSPHPPHTTLTGVQSNRTFRRHFGPSFTPCHSSAPLGVRPRPCALPTYTFRWLRCACA